MPSRRVLLLGAGDLSNETAAALRASDADLTRLEDPSAVELQEAVEAGADAVAVVSRDEAWPLRAALLVRHLDPDVPIVVTIFDPVAGRELEQQIGNCTIASLADIVAPSLAGPCVADELTAVLVRSLQRSCGRSTAAPRSSSSVRSGWWRSWSSRPSRRRSCSIRPWST